MKFLKDYSVTNKRVLVRCDFNVPIDEKGNILDDFRIRATLPTIQYLMDNRAMIILMSHLGKPDGKVVPALKLDKVAERLASYLNVTIQKEDDCIGPQIEIESNKLEPGRILLLENLRFHKEEETGGEEFAKDLSFLGDLYVNDAFGVCHRDNASMTLVPQLLPSCAGLLLEKEIESLNKVMKNPAKPMVVIVGGKKVETKSAFIDYISQSADFVLVGGLIAKEIADKNIKFKFPEKIIIPTGKLDAPDINEESIKVFREKILQAKTIIWNGPLGAFENKKYAVGTLAIAKAIAESGAYFVAGGGETIEFLDKQGMIDTFTHASTGGGAMIAYLAGEKLPGIAALR